MDPLVSIIVPIYNAENYLEECIQSIQRQAYKNLQIILVNDGSTDNSSKICNSYAAIDDRIITLNQKNSGVSAARNLGLSVAKGEYIGFVDSDDFINENMYKNMINIILQDESDLCAMINYTIKNPGEKYNNITLINNVEAIKSLLMLEFPTSLWAFLYSKKSINNIQLNSKIHFFEDFLFNLEVLENVSKISLYRDNSYYYRPNESSTNRQSINDKRLSSLEIYDWLDNFILKRKNIFSNYEGYFKAHNIISIIISIAKSIEVKQQYYDVTRKYGVHFIKNYTFNYYVPLFYKVVIILFVLFPKSFPRLLYFLKYK